MMIRQYQEEGGTQLERALAREEELRIELEVYQEREKSMRRRVKAFVDGVE